VLRDLLPEIVHEHISMGQAWATVDGDHRCGVGLFSEGFIADVDCGSVDDTGSMRNGLRRRGERGSGQGSIRE